jgi:PAS domain S-box-containing protein
MRTHGNDRAGPAGGGVEARRSPPADGDLRHLIHGHDWIATPLGDPAGWLPCLKIATELMLASSLPTALLWGRQLIQIYNDAYVAILGDDHPAALGRTWEAIRPDTAPLDRYAFARVFQGETLTFDDGVHPITRPGLARTSRLRACYAPVRDEGGDVLGIMITAVPASRPSGGSGQRLASALERAGVATFERDRTGNLMTLSSHGADILGLEPGERIRRCEDHDRLIHPDDAERHRQEIERAADRGGGYQVEYRVVRPVDGRIGWIEQRGTAVRDSETGAVSLGGALWDVGNRHLEEAGATQDAGASRDGADKQLERPGSMDRYAAQASDAIQGHLLRHDADRRLRSLIEGMPQLVWQARDGGDWIWASPQWIAHTGLSSERSLGLGWLSAVHPDDRNGVMAAWGSATCDEPLDIAFRVWHQPEARYRWFKTRATAEWNRIDGSLQWTGSSTDIDELYQLQERQRVLLGELQHRVRNTLAVIRSIARRTAETSDTVHDYAAHLDGRIGAFARVQAVVTRDPDGGVDLENLIAEELLAYHAQQGGQVRIVGPSIRLQPKAAETLGLAIHELATNAVKHGALSSRKGTVEVAWRLDAQASGPLLVFDWIETGMSEGTGSISRQGFGLILLMRTLAFDMKATAEASFDGPGIRWHITIPVTERLVSSQHQPMQSSDPLSAPGGTVED